MKRQESGTGEAPAPHPTPPPREAPAQGPAQTYDRGSGPGSRCVTNVTAARVLGGTPFRPCSALAVPQPGTQRASPAGSPEEAQRTVTRSCRLLSRAFSQLLSPEGWRYSCETRSAHGF